MKIAVGLSGGVDSAVSAALLKNSGFDVIGVFLKNWSDDFGIHGDCPWKEDQEIAYKVAKHLGIEFIVYNFELDYRKKVIEYFFNEYKKGNTPNPDVLCNSEIKFNIFLKKAKKELNVDKIATGHYARIFKDKYDVYHLLKGKDKNKDQSYFLCMLNQEELSQVEFPIGNLKKTEVRKIAKKINLPNAERKDSQGICFIGKINVKEFIKKEIGISKGSIIDIETNKVLGEHEGLWFYTIGQRKGIGLGGGPWFVVKKDTLNNVLYVAKGKNNIYLYHTRISIRNVNFINPSYGQNSCTSFLAEVSIRYRQEPAKAIVNFCKDINGEFKGEITFLKPQKAPSPGQFAAIYNNEELVASGVICEI